jgi:quercetin dioxygenase-like cupin family protein
MEHTPVGDIKWSPAPADNFTGRAWFGPLSSGDDAGDLVALGVHFEPGARTDWHHHPGGQTLYIAAGSGFVANDDGEVAVVGAGDVVSIPAGETHWHGASATSHMMHLSLTTGGATEWIDSKVDEADYRVATGK